MRFTDELLLYKLIFPKGQFSFLFYKSRFWWIFYLYGWYGFYFYLMYNKSSYAKNLVTPPISFGLSNKNIQNSNPFTPIVNVLKKKKSIYTSFKKILKKRKLNKR